jgi:hypothetical protein
VPPPSTPTLFLLPKALIVGRESTGNAFLAARGTSSKVNSVNSILLFANMAEPPCTAC